MTDPTIDPNRKPHSNYFARLFRGDIPLVITYWVWGILIVGMGTRLVVWLLESRFSTIILQEHGLLQIRTIGAVLIAISLFILIAIWRSAGKYQGPASYKVLARIVVLLNLAFITYTFFRSADSNSVIDEEIGMMNASLPVMVDEETRFDRVFREGQDLHYRYTLISTLRDDIDSELFNDAMRPALLEAACGEPGLRDTINGGRSLIYSYEDKDGALISAITIDSCSN